MCILNNWKDSLTFSKNHGEQLPLEKFSEWWFHFSGVVSFGYCFNEMLKSLKALRSMTNLELFSLFFKTFSPVCNFSLFVYISCPKASWHWALNTNWWYTKAYYIPKTFMPNTWLLNLEQWTIWGASTHIVPETSWGSFTFIVPLNSHNGPFQVGIVFSHLMEKDIMIAL